MLLEEKVAETVALWGIGCRIDERVVVAVLEGVGPHRRLLQEVLVRVGLVADGDHRDLFPHSFRRVNGWLSLPASTINTLSRFSSCSSSQDGHAFDLYCHLNRRRC